MITIHDYDELRAYVLKTREKSAKEAQDYKEPAARSFANGMVHACDLIYLAMLSWEKSFKEQEGP